MKWLIVYFQNTNVPMMIRNKCASKKLDIKAVLHEIV